jgi:hypothetical protein
VSSDLDPVVEVIEGLASTAFGLVDEIATRVVGVMERSDLVHSSELAVIDAFVQEELGRVTGPVQGAGFVAGVGVLADEPWWLEWFARDADNRVQRLVVQTDPKGMGFYDYEHLQWYVVPRDKGVRHVTGPYVDYLCTDDYTLTFTAPVLAAGRFVGVAGADVGVHAAERELIPVLRAAGRPVAVVNSLGRILASNSGRHLCGDLIAGDAELARDWDTGTDTGNTSIRTVGDLPLAVVAIDAFDEPVT